ncbi:GntR family transcriptional regulator [Pusillimonas sp. ANT_WB101]|uniref:GntR family transcriptional regulator n=1 Tax=Pusillimonas sp. ANT_WB101 TaxID=2597356 RepID=UPI0011EE3C20|nr:GntR family transcriptional regulator [Pusillimonas sp. ANT_WB101]KAA0892506.1 GntR family transcriptional regulator [Pusillimonas sp. ANT_WB101]
MPIELELCKQFGVSRSTVREALKQLVRQGLLVRKRGVGTRVCAVAPVSQCVQRMSGVSDLIQYATETTLHVDKSEIVSVSGDVAVMLGASEGETWLHVRGLRFTKGSELPISFTDIYIAPRFRSVEGVVGRVACAVYTLIDRQFQASIMTVGQEIRATILSEEMAHLLIVPPHTPGLVLARRYLDERGDLTVCAISVLPDSRFNYRETFRRDSVLLR